MTHRQKPPSIYPQPRGQRGWRRAEQLGGAKDRGFAPAAGVSNGNGKQGNPWMKNLTPQVASAGNKNWMYFQADWGHSQKQRQLRYGVDVWTDDGHLSNVVFMFPHILFSNRLLHLLLHIFPPGRLLVQTKPHCSAMRRLSSSGWGLDAFLQGIIIVHYYYDTLLKKAHLLSVPGFSL